MYIYIYIYTQYSFLFFADRASWGLWRLRRNFDCSLPWSLIGWRTMVSSWGYSRCLVACKPGENTWGVNCQYLLVTATSKKTGPTSEKECAVCMTFSHNKFHFTGCFSESIGRRATGPLLCLTNFQKSRCALDVLTCIWDMQWRSLFQQVAETKRV